jgi:hypothetical protein
MEWVGRRLVYDGGREGVREIGKERCLWGRIDEEGVGWRRPYFWVEKYSSWKKKEVKKKRSKEGRSTEDVSLCMSDLGLKCREESRKRERE